MAPPSKARPRVAYDLGRRGETLPDDMHDDPEMAGAYEMGVDDRDAASAGSPRRHGPPKPRRSAENDADDPSDTGLSDEADRHSAKYAGSRSRRGQLFAGPTDAAGGVNLSSKKFMGSSTGGGLFLGVIGYCLGRAFLTEGPHGMWRWITAKFANKITPRAGSTTSTPASPSAPQPQPTPQAGVQPAPAASTSPGRVVTT